jgi:hypothetical protein
MNSLKVVLKYVLRFFFAVNYTLLKYLITLLKFVLSGDITILAEQREKLNNLSQLIILPYQSTKVNMEQIRLKTRPVQFADKNLADYLENEGYWMKGTAFATKSPVEKTDFEKISRELGYNLAALSDNTIVQSMIALCSPVKLPLELQQRLKDDGIEP